MLRLSKSCVGQLEADAVSQVILQNGYLGMGNEVKAFEEEIEAFLGAPRGSVACVNSGTAALHLAVEAALKPGDEVLVQSLTYVASFQAICAAGATPVACDVVPETLTIDLIDARRRLGPRTKAIMPVHYAGNPGNLDSVYEFAGRHGLRVIEDAAHAFGCVYKGTKIGSRGDIVCFSFDGIKNITCGEGGALVSQDEALLSKVRDARLLGVANDSEKRYANSRSWEFDVFRRGYRFHMSNLMAAIGRVQLRRFSTDLGPRRVALAQIYREILPRIRQVRLVECDLATIVPHIQPMRVLGGRRDQLRNALESAEIQTGVHYKPNHLLSLFCDPKRSLPVTEALYGELLTLPLHPGLNRSDVERICRTVKDALERN